MSCVVQMCNQSRIEPDSVGRDGHEDPHVCHPGHADEGDPRAAASSAPGLAIVGERLRGAGAGHAPPAFFPRGRCGVCPCQSGLLVSVAAHSAATPRARTARDFPPRWAEARGSTSARSPCAHQGAPFSGGRSAWTTGCRDRGPPIRPSADRLVPERRAEAARPGPAGAQRTEQHRAAHADAASTRPWPQRSEDGADVVIGGADRLAGDMETRGRHGWRGRPGRPPGCRASGPPSHGSGLRRGGRDWRWGPVGVAMERVSRNSRVNGPGGR